MTQKYLKNKRITSGRAIYKILQTWKKDFIKLLEKEDKKGFFCEKKEDIIDGFITDIKYDLPDYYEETLPAVMTMGGKKNISKYKDLLPEGYSIAFDLPTDPAVKYINDLVDLNLSTRDGSTLKTTRDELRNILADGIGRGDSYWTIAKQIEEVDPFVFSKSRAKLIAINEIGRAYGWADHEPGRVLSDMYEMEKRWETSNDEKVRPEHQANEDEGWIPFDRAWSSTGDDYAPSQDINCRCTSTDRVTAIKTASGIIDVKNLSFSEIIELAKKNNFCNHKKRV